MAHQRIGDCQSKMSQISDLLQESGFDYAGSVSRLLFVRQRYMFSVACSRETFLDHLAIYNHFQPV